VGERVPVLVHEARLGADRYRVVRPARSLGQALLVDDDRWLTFSLDAGSARTVAGLWLLAARSPRSLIHLPLRAAGAPGDGSRLDLVLLHHSLQFAPARWKELRTRLGPGRPHIAELPPARPEIDFAARHYRENRDLFHQHVHAETLFMTGSARLFTETAGHFLDVAQHGPTGDDQHYCTRFHSNDGILGNARELHIEYHGLPSGDV
jgi:hypothetical protein